MRFRIKKCIALLLVVVLTISSIPAASVHAEENDGNIIELLSSDAKHEQEKIQEAMEDALLSKTQDWGTAVFKDGYYWNTFHNAVQDDIVENNKRVKKERHIVYGKRMLRNCRERRAERIYIWRIKIII